MKFEAYKVLKQRHRQTNWCAVGLIAVGAILFTMEILAPAGIMTVIGVVLQGIDAD